MIKKFFENSTQIELSYLALDWDDNILHMPTKIHLNHVQNGNISHVEVSTAKFAEVRNDPNWQIRPDSFSEFRDYGPRGDNAFLEDTKKAISSKNYGPSWRPFIEYLSKGTIFAIVTARGHEPESIKKGIKWIIDNVLSENEQLNLYSNCLKYSYLFKDDFEKYRRTYEKGTLSQMPLIEDYLNSCDFYCVSSDSFRETFGLGDSSNPELGKELAIKKFTEKVKKFGEKILAKKVSLGFSDDDVRNIQHMDRLFRNELMLTYATISLTIYDTSNRGIEGGIKTKYKQEKIETRNEGQSSYGLGMQTRGMDSSVLPFSSWNAMTKNLYPATQDAPKDDTHNHFKNKIGQIGDLTKHVTKKTRRRNEKSKRVRKLRK